MRRIFLVLAACAMTTFALVAPALASDMSKSGHLGVGASGPNAKKPPKGTKYDFIRYSTAHEVESEGEELLYKKTHTWETIGFCSSGTYTKEGKKLILVAEGDCEAVTSELEKVKGKAGAYYGPVYENVTRALFGYEELIKE
jgi:hypothetical protein